MSQTAVQTLQRRIAEMQPLRLPERELPVHPALSSLLPGRVLRAGACYSVQGSWQLATLFLAEASRSGAWAGIVGYQDFGAEAAATQGVALDRCVHVPDPGEHLLPTVAVLIESLSVVLVEAPVPPNPHEAERLAAKLREHGSTLVVAGAWPRPTADLRVTGSHWSGLDPDFGKLRNRLLTVQVRSASGTEQHVLRFVDGVPEVRG